MGRIVLRYVMIWLVLFLVLWGISVGIHWERVSATIQNHISTLISGIAVCAIMLGGIIFMIRSVFR